jgi:hypothetical protein
MNSLKNNSHYYQEDKERSEELNCSNPAPYMVNIKSTFLEDRFFNKFIPYKKPLPKLLKLENYRDWFSSHRP